MSEGKDIRGGIVDATMALAAHRRFEDVTIRDIAAEGGVSLADFRDAFPSKGAVLGGLNKRIDREVLKVPLGELASSSARDRLFDVLMRRLDAMAPYRDGLREIDGWLRRDPTALMAMNQLTVNSMRFMLEAAEIDADGPAAAVKLQGLALAWSRVVSTWLGDTGPDYSKTMAALDRELSRGQRMVGGLERIERMTEPLRNMARAVARRRSGEPAATDPASDPA